MQGYTHIYTGNGKGKTTAALGMALRAAGNGMQVFVAQFVKGKTYSEVHAVRELLPTVTLVQYGREAFIHGQPGEADIEVARQGMQEVERIVDSGSYDLIILDEICIALYFKLIDEARIIRLIEQKPAKTELILTGRYAPQSLMDKADLVTEMQEVKHYYQQGVQARKGFEF